MMDMIHRKLSNLDTYHSRIRQIRRDKKTAKTKIPNVAIKRRQN